MTTEYKNVTDVGGSLLILHFLLGPLLLAVATYMGGDPGLGHTFLGLFLVCSLLYWFYGRDYFEGGLFPKKRVAKNDRSQKSKTAKTLHIYFIISFIIGPILWAAICYWVGESAWGHVSVGMFFFWSILYWFYGIDYFQVDWLQNLKHDNREQ